MAPFDHASVRLRLQRLLSTADLEPSGMPAAAILLVRHVDDPLPGRVTTGSHDAFTSREWQRAAQAALARCYDEACPAAGPVPARHERSALHRSWSELLTCLARDVLLGGLAGTWWWQTWLRATGHPTLDTVVGAWLRDARQIPASMAALHRARLAARFAGMLAAREAHALFAAMADAYDLPLLGGATSSMEVAGVVAPHREPAADARTQLPDAEGLGEESSSSAAAEVFAPWEAIVEGVCVPKTLGVRQRALLGVARALGSAQRAVRTRAFEATFHRWRRSVQRGAAPAARMPLGPKRAIERPEESVPPPPAVIPDVAADATPRITSALETEPTPIWVAEPRDGSSRCLRRSTG